MQQTPLKLDVMISTHGPHGLSKVADMQLPTVSGVRYLVSWQARGVECLAVPDELQRPDIKIWISDTAGLSVNRNLLFSHTTASYCLIADNDVTYRPDQLQAVIDTFDSHPTLDVAQFKYDNARKRYPQTEVDLTHAYPRGHYIDSVELAFRRQSIIGKVWINENFGLGTDLGCCEDPIFMLDCRRLGMDCRFFPIEILHHDGDSTGTRPMTDPATPRGQGAYIRYAYGLLGLPRIPVVVLREWRRGRIGLWFGLKHYLRGFLTPLGTIDYASKYPIAADCSQSD